MSLSGLAPALRERNITPTTPIERHHRDDKPSEILPFLFVGAEAHAENEEMLNHYAITHVLNLTTRSPKRVPGIKYLAIPIRDSWNQNLVSHFEEAFAFVEEAKREGRIL